MSQVMAPTIAYKSRLHEMTQCTPTCLWNDSASIEELKYAIEHGAVGATCNPVIVLGVLKKEMSLWKDRIAALLYWRIRNGFLHILVRASEQRPSPGNFSVNMNLAIRTAANTYVAGAIAEIEPYRPGDGKGALESIVGGSRPCWRKQE